MEVKAHAKFIRMSPRKVKLIADLIRGLDVNTAETQLRFAVKEAKEPMMKLLKSAVANAVNNFNLKKENLFVKTIYVNEGPMLKRFTPKAFGRAGEILKRMCHITIILDENVESKKIENKSSAVKTTKAEKSEIKNPKSETNSKDKKIKLKSKKTV